MISIGREKRIQRAMNTIKSILEGLPKDKLKIATPLIQRIAFMQITLEDLEDDINVNGTTEMFSQTQGISYERERPSVRMYNSIIGNYNKSCKQLYDLIPSGDKNTAQSDVKDKLIEFLNK